MPYADQKNALIPVYLVEMEYLSETNVLYFRPIMHFSMSTIYNILYVFSVDSFMQTSFRKYIYGAALMACVPFGFAGISGSSIDQEAMQQLQDKIKEQSIKIIMDTENPVDQYHDDRILKYHLEYLKLLEELNLQPDSAVSREELADAIPGNQIYCRHAAYKLKSAIKSQVTPDMARYFYIGQWIHDSEKKPELSLEEIQSIGKLDIFQKGSEEIIKSVGKLERSIKRLYPKNTVRRSKRNIAHKTASPFSSASERVVQNQFDTLKKLPGLRPVDVLRFTHLIDTNKKLIRSIYEKVHTAYAGVDSISATVNITNTFDKLNMFDSFYDTLLQLLHFTGAEPVKISSLTSEQRCGMLSLFVLARENLSDKNDFSEIKKKFAAQYEENTNTLDGFIRVNDTLAGSGEKTTTIYIPFGGQLFIMLEATGSQLTVGLYPNDGLLLAYRIPEENNAGFLASLMRFLSPIYTQCAEDVGKFDHRATFTCKGSYFFEANMPESRVTAVNDEYAGEGYPAKSASCNCLGFIFAGCKNFCSLVASAVTYPFFTRESRMEVGEDE